MKVYKCIVTGDELFTDTYPVETVGGLYRIRCKYVTRSELTLDESKLGANPSAEEAAECAGDSSVSGINVVLDNRLQKTCFGTKKEFMVYFKEFVKRLEENKVCQEPNLDLAEWRANIQVTFKSVLASFDSYEFYTGESCNPDGNVCLIRWEPKEGEPDEIPYMYVLKEGVREEKC